MTEPEPEPEAQSFFSINVSPSDDVSLNIYADTVTNIMNDIITGYSGTFIDISLVFGTFSDPNTLGSASTANKYIILSKINQP